MARVVKPYVARCEVRMGLLAFLWSLRSGQYDDLEGAAYRILTDEDLKEPKE